MKVYYFGMHRPEPDRTLGECRATSYFTERNPWGYAIDGGLCPKGPEIEGRALIHHKDGWTAMSFWDRSVDHRGKCNSSFLAEGTFTFEEMLAIAREKFPRVVGRFKFEIVPAEDRAGSRGE
jgi:hypothetical protein